MDAIQTAITVHDAEAHAQNVKIALTALVLQEGRVRATAQQFAALPLGVLAWIKGTDGSLSVAYVELEDAELVDDAGEVTVMIVAHERQGFRLAPELVERAIKFNMSPMGLVVSELKDDGVEWFVDIRASAEGYQA